jgi:hypothetical protein
MVFFSSFGFDFIVFNPALLFVIIQLLTYVIANELGKEKLEPERDLRESGDNTVKKSHSVPPDFPRNQTRQARYTLWLIQKRRIGCCLEKEKGFYLGQNSCNAGVKDELQRIA